MAIRLARYYLLGKLETTYGSDASPTNDDVILAQNLSFKKEFNPINVKVGSSAEYYKALTGNMFATLSFDVPLRVGYYDMIQKQGDISKLLQACGYDVDASSDNEFVAFMKPESQSSMTFYYLHDGLREKITGARGSAKFTIKAGEVPMVHFEFTGLYNGVDTATMASSVDYGAKNGDIFVAKGATMTVGGTDYHTELLEFADNNKLVVIPSVSATNGVYMIEFADAEPSGNVDVLVETSNASTLEGLVTSESSVTISFKKGTSENPTITITAFVNDREMQDADGLLRYKLGFAINGITINLEAP